MMMQKGRCGDPGDIFEDMNTFIIAIVELSGVRHVSTQVQNCSKEKRSGVMAHLFSFMGVESPWKPNGMFIRECLHRFIEVGRPALKVGSPIP